MYRIVDYYGRIRDQTTDLAAAERTAKTLENDNRRWFEINHPSLSDDDITECSKVTIKEIHS